VLCAFDWVIGTCYIYPKGFVLGNAAYPGVKLRSKLMVVVVVQSVDTAAAETRVHGVCSWFIECSRTDAEAILTKCHRNGNVMMRPSTSSRVTGRYVISMRSDTGRLILC